MISKSCLKILFFSLVFISLFIFSFSYVRAEEVEPGLVPCGRPDDSPATPYNETDSCQIPHLFLLLRNVLDFMLWKIATIMLALLSVVAGLLFYFSWGDSSVIFKVRSLLKSAIMGYAILLFAWLGVNLFLAFLGYKFQFFGNWWEIKF